MTSMTSALLAKCPRSIVRCYHTKTGVYGVRPRRTTTSASVAKSVPSNVDHGLIRLRDAYRTYGHRKAQLDPLGLRNSTEPIPELDLSQYGLEGKLESDVDGSSALVQGLAANSSISQLLSKLNEVYCGHAAAEFMHLEVIIV